MDKISIKYCNDLNDIDNLSSRSITIGISKSGKTLFISNLLYNKIIKSNPNDKIILLFFSQSLIDYNHIYTMILFYYIKLLNYKINNKYPKCLINFLNKFELKNYLKNKDNLELFNNDSDNFIKYILKTIIEEQIKPLLIKYKIEKDENNYKRNVNFYFKSNILEFKTFIDKIKENNFISDRKIHIIIDDLDENSNEILKPYINLLFEQGRHYNISINFIDQYIKSKKITPAIRTNTNLIFLRSFDLQLIKFIEEKSGIKISKVDKMELVKFIKDYYTIIFDCSTFDFFIYKCKPLYFDMFSDDNNLLNKQELSENSDENDDYETDEEESDCEYEIEDFDNDE